MSRMNELSIEVQEEAYAQYVESLNQDLRQEGAEELRAEILRMIAEQAKSINGEVSVLLGLTLASDIVKRASI